MSEGKSDKLEDTLEKAKTDQATDDKQKAPQAAIQKQATEPSQTTSPGALSLESIVGFTKWHPFLELFQFTANHFYPKQMEPSTRFRYFAEKHKVSFYILFWLDVLVVLLLVVAFFVLISLIGYKTFF